jgi:hypothetical protein
MTQLDIIAAQPADTPLRQILDPFDRYDLFDELEATGRKAAWERVLGFETCGQVIEWAGGVDA